MARSFNGTTQYLSNGAAFFPTISPGKMFSVSAWFYTSDTSSTQGIWSNSNSPNGDTVWLLVSSGAAVAQMRDNTGGDTSNASAFSSATYSANTWHHICGWFYAWAGGRYWETAVWLDGGNKGTYLDYDVAGARQTSFHYGHIGTARREIGYGYYFNGSIAEVAVLDDVQLTDADAAALAAGTPPQQLGYTLRGYWPLGGFHGENDKDHSSSGYDLAAANTPTWTDHPGGLWYPRSTISTGLAANASGEASITFGASANLDTKTLIAASNPRLVFDSQSSLGVAGPLSSEFGLVFEAAGSLESVANLSGSSDLTFGEAVAPAGYGTLAGETSITFSASAILNPVFAASNYLEDAILDHIFGKATYTPASNIYLALCTAGPDDADTGLSLTEAAYSGYARKETQASDWNTAAADAIDNSNAITFDPATGGSATITHCAIVDALTGGNVLFYGRLSDTFEVSSGVVPSFESGDIAVSLYL